MTRHLPPEPTSGPLAASEVDAWKARLSSVAGVDVPPPPIHRVGTEAVDFYGVEPSELIDPREFEVLMYRVPLTLMESSVAVLRSPVRLEFTEDDKRLRLGDNLMVGSCLDHAATYVEPGARDHLYRPGELILTGNSPAHLLMSDGPVDSVGVVIPRELLGRNSRAIERSWQPFVSGSVLARATAAFITSFAVSTAIGVEPNPSAETEEAVVEVIVSALGELTGTSSSLTDNPLLVREAVLDVIERRYSDVEFGVDMIAADLHLSRRQIYRYFEASGQSLAARIAERRIEAAIDLLNSQPQTPIGAVARRTGFASVATFRNRFRTRVGIGPTEYRAALLSGLPVPTDAITD